MTSSDSGSLIIDIMAANGDQEPPTLQRVFWALVEGATATALLVAGGKDSLDALQVYPTNPHFQTYNIMYNVLQSVKLIKLITWFVPVIGILTTYIKSVRLPASYQGCLTPSSYASTP